MSLLAAIPLIDKVLDFIPNKNERERIKGELEAAGQRGELDLALGQMDINKTEAAHKSLFVAGWRPAVGWTCALGLFVKFIILPIGSWIATVIFDVPTDQIPVFSIVELLTLLGGMLGLAKLRTDEKSKGVAREK